MCCPAIWVGVFAAVFTLLLFVFWVIISSPVCSAAVLRRCGLLLYVFEVVGQ